MTKPTKSVQGNRKSLISQVSRRTSHNDEALWPREYLGRRQCQTLDNGTTKPLMEGKNSDIQEFQNLHFRNDLRLWECKITEAGNVKPQTPGTTSGFKKTIPQNAKPWKQARNTKLKMPGTTSDAGNTKHWKLATPNLGAGDTKPQILDADPSDTDPSDTNPMDADPLDAEPRT